MNFRSMTFGMIACALLGGTFFLGTRVHRPPTEQETHEPEAEAALAPNTYAMTQDAQRNIQLTTQPVLMEQVDRTLHLTGNISPDQARVAHVYPLSQGIVRDIFVQLGSTVRSGQPLLRYDSVELGNTIGERNTALGAFQKARAQQEVSAKSLSRADNLLRVEAISQREYEVRKAEKDQADAEVVSAQADLATAEEKLHRFGLSNAQIAALGSDSSHRTSSLNSVRAPIGGVVSGFAVSPGALIAPEKELFSIVDPSTVWALGDIYEKDLRFVHQQGVCRVSLTAFPQTVFLGRITYLSEGLDPQSRTAKLRCVLPNDGNRIRLDMFADIEIPTSQKQSGLTVPNEAIQELNDEPIVFVQRAPELFEMRKIKLGVKGDRRTEVQAGVKAGDVVVSNGTLQLKFQALRGTLGDSD